MSENQPLIFQAESGALELKGDLSAETLWATQKQLAEVFVVDVRTISEHLKNIFKAHELDENAVVRKFRITAADGKSYLTNHYNLDAILSVGYRVNSKKATRFRQWATKTLKQHITEGYTINPARIEQNKRAFLAAVEDLRRLSTGNQAVGPDDLLSLVAAFAQTWFSLEAYDEDNLPSQGKLLTSIPLEAKELYKAVEVLKAELVRKAQATALFAQEKTQGSLEGILGSVFQSAFGEDAYPTLEEKAANLLYRQKPPLQRRQQTDRSLRLHLVPAKGGRSPQKQNHPRSPHGPHPTDRRKRPKRQRADDPVGDFAAERRRATMKDMEKMTYDPPKEIIGPVRQLNGEIEEGLKTLVGVLG